MPLTGREATEAMIVVGTFSAASAAHLCFYVRWHEPQRRSFGRRFSFVRDGHQPGCRSSGIAESVTVGTGGSGRAGPTR